MLIDFSRDTETRITTTLLLCYIIECDCYIHLVPTSMRKTPSDFDRNNRRYEQKLYHNPLTIALKKPKKFKSSPIGSVRELFLQHHVNLVPHTQSDDVIRWIKRQTTEHCVRLANLRYTNSSEMQPLTNGRVLTSAKSMYQHKVGARPLGKILQENAPPPLFQKFYVATSLVSVAAKAIFKCVSDFLLQRTI